VQLNVREWGSGDRTALLVHGIMSDSRPLRASQPILPRKPGRGRGDGTAFRAWTGIADM
jgi:hypothetical protein